jgi:Rap1a immunity proteins
MKRIVLLCCLLLATTAKTEESRPYVSVNALLRSCDTNDRVQEIFCKGYLSGLTDTIEDIRRINKNAPCLTRPIEWEELRSVVVGFLRTRVRDNAKWGNEPAVSLASMAIGQAWCPGQ